MLFIKIFKGSSRFDESGIISVCCARRLGDKVIIDAHLAHLCLCHIFGVSAEHNVRASTCHIRRNGDSTKSTRLGYYFRLTLVLLRVKDVVGDAVFLQNGR